MQKKRLLIFHPALAPYRIDQFNLLNEQFDLEVVFLMENLSNFDMDQQKLRDSCQFKISYLLHGLLIKRRLIRFGILRKIRSVNPDIVMGFEFSITTQYLFLLKKLGLINQKIGSFIDDSPDICKNVQTKLREWVRDRSVRKLDFMVVMSKEVARFYRDYFNLNSRKVLVSPILQLAERLRLNSFIIEQIANTYVHEFGLKGKRTLLFVGRLVPEKALSVFIEGIAPILLSNDDVRLVLVGNGGEEERLRTKAKEKRIDDKVIFAGKHQSEDLYGWYACASGFVLPSVSETFGAVVDEALIFGLRVLCSSYAGAASLISDRNGLLFDPLNETDTYDKARRFINGLDPVGAISLADSPPLIEDCRSSFLLEWKKILEN